MFFFARKEEIDVNATWEEVVLLINSIEFHSTRVTWSYGSHCVKSKIFD